MIRLCGINSMVQFLLYPGRASCTALGVSIFKLPAVQRFGSQKLGVVGFVGVREIISQALGVEILILLACFTKDPVGEGARLGGIGNRVGVSWDWGCLLMRRHIRYLAILVLRQTSVFLMLLCSLLPRRESW